LSVAQPLKDDLDTLTSATGVSGCEDEVMALTQELLRPLVDTLTFDKAGNLVGFLSATEPPPSGSAPLVCWCAHIDEVGLIVTGHTGRFLTFQPIGNLDARVLPNAQVEVLAEPRRPGVVTCLPPHVLADGDSSRAFTMDELLIDIGLTAEETARIPVGTRAVYRRGLNGLQNAATGPALDNRACFAVMLDALRSLGTRRRFDLMVCATTAEEAGRVGAMSLDTRDCATCIVLDVTYAHMPGLPQDHTVPRRAAAIGVGPNITRKLSDMAAETAQRHGIPFSREVLPSDTGTDAWVIQLSKGGVPTLLLSLPILSMHTPAETVYWDDLEHLSALLAQVTINIAAGAAE